MKHDYNCLNPPRPSLTLPPIVTYRMEIRHSPGTPFPSLLLAVFNVNQFYLVHVTGFCSLFNRLVYS